MGNHIKKKVSFKSLFAVMFTLILMESFFVPGLSAQTSYSDLPFLYPSALFNQYAGFSYNNSNLFSQYQYGGFGQQWALPYTGQWYGGLGNNYTRYTAGYGNTYYNAGLTSLFNNPFSSGLFTSSIPTSQFNGLGVYGAGYGYGIMSPLIMSNPFSTTFMPGILSGGLYPGGYGSPIYPPIYNMPSLIPNIFTMPRPSSYCDPADAPNKIAGTWQSDQLTGADDSAATGKLSVNRNETLINMQDSPLSLGEGTITEFNYTRTQGEAPISFKATFYSGHSATFTGIADNMLCCRNVYCAWGGIFVVEGNYVIKDGSGQTVDTGTFSIEGPVRSNSPDPEPDESIVDLGKPYSEGHKILSLTTGPDGRIYGSTEIGCLNVAHMFIYDPATGGTTDPGNPGYECNAMTTGTDGLIYLGGGTSSAGDHDCTSIGYANFAIYDPQGAWNPGSGSGANPRDLGQAVSFSGEVDGHPLVVHDLVTAPNGKIYGCTGYRDGRSGDLYAHLFVYDPQTGAITDLGSPIPNQSSITRLTCAPDGTVYGVIMAPRTTYRHPPGKLFSYNPASGSFAIIDTPSSIEGTIDLTMGKEGLLYCAGGESDSYIFTYDPVSGAFDPKGSLGGCGAVLRMRCADDGIIYIGCAVNGYFVRYDPEIAWEDSSSGENEDTPGINPTVYHHTGKVNAIAVGQNGYVYFGNLEANLYVFTGE